MVEFYPRWQQKVIEQAMEERRVLLLTGPRQCGKTTLAKALRSDATEYRTLDDLTLKHAAESDPHNFVKRRSKTLIIDEVQRVPELLPAVKMAVDEDTTCGQYLLTGSANIQSIPTVTESLAGRVCKIRLRPLSQGEYLKVFPGFLEHAFKQSFAYKFNPCDRDHLLQVAMKGGYPEAVKQEERACRQWHSDYIEALLERDLKDIARINRMEAMRELVNVLAAWSGKFMDLTAIGSGLSIRRNTIESYINALETLYLVERVRPWTKTDYQRVGKQNKLFMTDSGLMASILKWKPEKIWLDSDRIGKLFETFAFNEISAQIDAGNGAYDLYHYRDREKREIDFLVEREDGALLGIEIKAAATVKQADFRHLRWFKDHLMQDKPFTGVVLYSGERPVSFGDNQWAIPIAMLWS